MIEFYKFSLNSRVIKEDFTKRVFHYNLRSFGVTFLPNPKSERFGTDTVASEVTHALKILPVWYKSFRSLDLFRL